MSGGGGMTIERATVTSYTMPLEHPVTTIPIPAAPSSSSRDINTIRHGLFFTVDIKQQQQQEQVSYQVSGEIAPLPGLHTESLAQAQTQADLVAAVFNQNRAGTGVPLPRTISDIDAWLNTCVGIEAYSLYPSVRCGVEGALLSAMASAPGSSWAKVLLPGVEQGDDDDDGNGNGKDSNVVVKYNAMIDPRGDVENIPWATLQLNNNNNTVNTSNTVQALKIKVGRASNVLDDAKVVLEIRQRLGASVVLRVDANQRWTLDDAIVFGKAIQSAGIEYIEEPIANPSYATLQTFHEKTGIAVALDESFDDGTFTVEEGSTTTIPPGVTALVVKPSVLGGYVRCLEIAQKMNEAVKRPTTAVVVSAVFESPLGLMHLSHVASAVDRIMASSNSTSASQYHGLGTFAWWGMGDERLQDVVRTMVHCSGGGGGIRVQALDEVLDRYNCTSTIIQSNSGGEDSCIKIDEYTMHSSSTTHAFHVVDVVGVPRDDFTVLTNKKKMKKTIFFLHGFLGSPEEWLPYMKTLVKHNTSSTCSCRCIAIALPGHGHTTSTDGFDVESIAEALCDALTHHHPSLLHPASRATGAEEQGEEEVAVVGYSLGARLALLLSSRYPCVFPTVVSISGSAGLEDEQGRRERAEVDAQRAKALCSGGSGSISAFMDTWYRSSSMWDTLRVDRPDVFDRLKRSRVEKLKGKEAALASVLHASSPGRAPPVKNELVENVKTGVLRKVVLIAGEEDAKFVKSNAQLCAALEEAARAGGVKNFVIRGGNVGHSVHIEAPLALYNILQNELFSVYPDR